jgi:hypothetical protein
MLKDSISLKIINKLENKIQLTPIEKGVPDFEIRICEAKSTQLNIITNGTGFNWTPANGLNNDHIANPVASPTTTTTYTVTVQLGVCTQSEQILVNVDKAPIANAGQGTTICDEQNTQLNGSGGLYYEWKPSTYLDNAQVAAPTVTKPTSSQYTKFGICFRQEDEVGKYT